jgi:hypothetical protein
VIPPFIWIGEKTLVKGEANFQHFGCELWQHNCDEREKPIRMYKSSAQEESELFFP